MTLSENTRESIKISLSIALSYTIALAMNWDEPKWAAFSVIVISTASMGVNLNRGTERFTGTIAAILVSATLIELFAQHRWAFISVFALWYAIGCHGNMGQKHAYFWFIALQVSLVLSIDSAFDPAVAFFYFALRVQETALGVVVYSLVMTFLWPRNSGTALTAAAAELASVQQQLFSTGRERLSGTGDPGSLPGLRQQELQGLANLNQVLFSAVRDTDEVREVADRWTSYQRCTAALAEGMQRWRDSLRDVSSLPLHEHLPGLESGLGEIESRFSAFETMLAREKPDSECRSIDLEIAPDSLAGLDGFDRVALEEFRYQLQQIDTHTRNLCQLLADIRGFSPPLRELPIREPRTGFIPDYDRLLASARTFLLMWAMFLIVIYVPDFPGGYNIIILAGAFGLNLVKMPQVPLKLTFFCTYLSLTVSALLYMLVMPQLSTFLELGIILFALCLFYCLIFNHPVIRVPRILSLIITTAMIDVANTQTYSFDQVQTNFLVFSCLFLVMTVFVYIPFSPLPEHALMHRLRRYFRSAATLLAEQVHTPGAPRDSLRLRFHRNEVATLPEKMQAWIPHATADFGPLAAERLPVLFGKLKVLSYRLRLLEEARERPLPADLPPGLRETLDAWRNEAVAALRDVTGDPTVAGMPRGASLTKLMASVEQAVGEALESGDVSGDHAEAWNNLYLRLAAFRGVSEALTDFGDAAKSINWEPWLEPRFA